MSAKASPAKPAHDSKIESPAKKIKADATMIDSVKVIGVCNPLLDISAVVKPDLLKKYELEPSNQILAEPKHIPLYAELIKDYQVTYVPGGSGCNTMRFGQWLSEKPYTFAYVGSVGDDDYGKILKDELKKDHVVGDFYTTNELPTGTCAALVTNKQRSLVANLSAAEKFSKDHLESAQTKAMIANAQILYVTGFLLTHSFEAAQQLGEVAVKENKIFMMNLSAPFLMQVPFFLERIVKMIPYLDYVFCNNHEADAFAKSQGWEEGNLALIAEKLAKMEKKNSKRERVVVFTHGGNPAVIWHDGKVTLYPVIPIKPELFVDENGAGDAYLGGFMAGLAEGKPIKYCAALGAYAAFNVLQFMGCAIPSSKPYVVHEGFEFGQK